MKKSDTISLTVSTEAVFLIMSISAKEKRDEAVVDIPGAFLQAELDGDVVHVKF